MVGKVYSYRVSDIRVGDRRIGLDEVVVQQLMESIGSVGLLQPIGIRADGLLVYGYHRLEACRRLGWDAVPVVMVEGDDLLVELAEIDENLVRNELSVLERAEQLLRRKEIYERLYPETRAELQRLRGLKQFQDSESTNASGAEIISAPERILSPVPEVPTFAQDTAAKVGVSERSVRHMVQIASQLAPEVREQLRHTPIADSKTELLQLARLEPERQVPVAEMLVSGRYQSVREAVDRLRRDERRGDRPVLRGVYEGLEIRRGDFREVLADLADASVDVILTDPPYPQEYLPLWSDLGRFAARVLKPSGVLLAYSGQLHLPEVLARLTEHLRWWWMCAIQHAGASGYIVSGGRRIQNYWKPLLVLTRKDAPPLDVQFKDWIEGGGRQKELHNWEQSSDEAVRILQMFAPQGGLVVDPFAGSGSFGRAAEAAGMRFIGAEILLLSCEEDREDESSG